MASIRKKEIFAAAAQLFEEKGYAASSMRDLAERVQLRASSLYSHIGSKEEILREICFEHARLFLQTMNEAEQLPGGVVDKIRHLLQFHMQIAIEQPASITIFNDEWRHLSEPSLAEFLEMRRDYESRFLALVEQGMAQGIVRSLDARVALYTLLSGVRWVHYWYRPKRGVNPEHLRSQVLDVLLGGLLT
jgi:AcrR family transcriptional regulator